MKRLFFILAIATTCIACQKTSTKCVAPASDTVAVAVDTLAVDSVAVDTVAQ